VNVPTNPAVRIKIAQRPAKQKKIVSLVEYEADSKVDRGRFELVR